MPTIDGALTYEQEALRLALVACYAILGDEHCSDESKLALIRRVLPREPSPFVEIMSHGF